MRTPTGVWPLLACFTLRLAAGDVAGVVLGPGGKPVAGAVVAVTPVTPNALSDGAHAARVTRTDARGRFRWVGLPGGRYGATATGSGLGSCFRGDLLVPGTGTLTGLSFHLGREGVTTTGRIRGLPPSVLRRLQVYGVRASEEAGDLFYGEVRGDRYRLSLAPGFYTLRAGAPGWVAVPVGLQVPGGTRSMDLRCFPERGRLPALAGELEAMARLDQALREASMAHPEDAGRLRACQEADDQHEARLKAILAEHGWPGAALVGPQAAGSAWLLVQHASAGFLKVCLPLMTAAAQRGELAWSSVALSIDRDRMNDGKPQRYGSQFHLNARGQLEAWPIEDEAHLEARRAEVGLEPFARYKAELLSSVPPPPPGL